MDFSMMSNVCDTTIIINGMASTRTVQHMQLVLPLLAEIVHSYALARVDSMVPMKMAVTA